MATADLFEQSVSRVVFVQFYLAPQIFQSIDESMTQEATDFRDLQQNNIPGDRVSTSLNPQGARAERSRSPVTGTLLIGKSLMASILKQRNPDLPEDQHQWLAEVCVHISNAVMLAALRSRDEEHRQRLSQQIEELLVSYLEPHMGDSWLSNVMKVMMCPHCQSNQLSKNGYRRGKQCYLCKDCGKQFVVQ